MNKFTLQALALTGILAVSGLPALAADMAPASPAPSASVSADSKAKVGSSVDNKANVGTSVDNKAKTSLDKSAVDKSKSATEKKVDKSSKDVSKDKKKVEQTAAKPAPKTPASSSTSIGADHAGANASTGGTVQH
jgi:hypothetical protein